MRHGRWRGLVVGGLVPPVAGGCPVCAGAGARSCSRSSWHWPWCRCPTPMPVPAPAAGTPRDRLTAADGAFIGALVGRRGTSPLRSIVGPGPDVVYTFEVAEVVKGGIGQRVEVYSWAGCGFEVDPGEAVGVLLERHRGRWRSRLCQQIEPGKLRAAAAPLPAPDGQGPAALVVGGSVGEARLLTLDRQGRTLAYGYGEGLTVELSICPDGGRMLELVGDHRRPSRLALRELPGLRLVWERPLPLRPLSISAQSVRCLDGTGSGYVFAVIGGDSRGFPQATLLRVSRTTTTVLYRGTARSIAFGGDVGYVNEGRWGEAIGRINLHSGQGTPVVTGPRDMSRLVLAPDGSALATYVWGEDLTQIPGGDRRGARPPQVAVIDLEPSPPQVRTAFLEDASQTQPGRGVWGNMVWLNANRLGYFPGPGTHPQAHIFDRSLRELGGFDNWTASTTLPMGEGIIGLGTGRLTAADLPNGGGAAPQSPSARAAGRRG
jgi:hypothetical protein